MGQITATRNLVATKVVRLAGQQLFKVFGKECKNFNQLDEWGKFVFMLNSEGKLAAATGKMIHDVISVTRCLPAWTRY